MPNSSENPNFYLPNQQLIDRAFGTFTNSKSPHGENAVGYLRELQTRQDFLAKHGQTIVDLCLHKDTALEGFLIFTKAIEDGLKDQGEKITVLPAAVASSYHDAIELSSSPIWADSKGQERTLMDPRKRTDKLAVVLRTLTLCSPVLGNQTRSKLAAVGDPIERHDLMLGMFASFSCFNHMQSDPVRAALFSRSYFGMLATDKARKAPFYN